MPNRRRALLPAPHTQSQILQYRIKDLPLRPFGQTLIFIIADFYHRLYSEKYKEKG